MGEEKTMKISRLKITRRVSDKNLKRNVFDSDRFAFEFKTQINEKLNDIIVVRKLYTSYTIFRERNGI